MRLDKLSVGSKYYRNPWIVLWLNKITFIVPQFVIGLKNAHKMFDRLRLTWPIAIDLHSVFRTHLKHLLKVISSPSRCTGQDDQNGSIWTDQITEQANHNPDNPLSMKMKRIITPWPHESANPGYCIICSCSFWLAAKDRVISTNVLIVVCVFAKSSGQSQLLYKLLDLLEPAKTTRKHMHQHTLYCAKQHIHTCLKQLIKFNALVTEINTTEACKYSIYINETRWQSLAIHTKKKLYWNLWFFFCYSLWPAAFC